MGLPTGFAAYKADCITTSTLDCYDGKIVNEGEKSTASNEVIQNGEMTLIKDVRDDHKYRFAIEFVLDNGYLKLSSSKKFLPNRAITREEFLHMISLALKFDVKSEKDSCFGDLRLAKYPKEACYALRKGFLSERYSFFPKRGISKAEAAKLLMSSYAYPNAIEEGYNSYYNDISNVSWYARYVVQGRKSNIFPVSRRFEPSRPLTRQEASAWIYNISRFQFTPSPTHIVNPSEYAMETLTYLINTTRESNGKSKLEYHKELYSLADIHSRKMAETNALAHGNITHYLDFLDPSFNQIAENIAVVSTVKADNLAKSIENVHEKMMNEPLNQKNHRSNILGDYKYLAVAVYEDEKNKRLWITQIFGK